MRVLIVDDEAPARYRLRRLLEELGMECVGEAADGAAALRQVSDLKPDAVLLDIRMPGIDGMETARQLRELPEPPAVIFITAYGDHALEAFENRAVDYLLKPVRRQRLQEALQRVRPAPRGEAYLTFQHQGNVSRIPFGDLFYLQADAKYVIAHHRQGDAVLDDSLKVLEEQFGDRLLRVHRGTLVARAALRGMQKTADGGYCALLEGTDDRPEISRRHISEVREWLRGNAAE